MNNVSK